MWLLDKFLIAFACLPPIHLLWFSISAERPGLCTARPALWKLGLEMSRVVGCSHLSTRLCSYNYLTYLHGVSGLRSCGGNVVPCGAGRCVRGTTPLSSTLVMETKSSFGTSTGSSPCAPKLHLFEPVTACFCSRDFQRSFNVSVPKSYRF